MPCRREDPGFAIVDTDDGEPLGIHPRIWPNAKSTFHHGCEYLAARCLSDRFGEYNHTASIKDERSEWASLSIPKVLPFFSHQGGDSGTIGTAFEPELDEHV